MNAIEQYEKISSLKEFYTHSDQTLFHYTNKSAADCILNSSGITFKMRNIYEFKDDISEGTLVPGCYITAIKELKEEEQITESEYNRLINIQIPERRLFLKEIQNKFYGTTQNFSMYVFEKVIFYCKFLCIIVK